MRNSVTVTMIFITIVLFVACKKVRSVDFVDNRSNEVNVMRIDDELLKSGKVIYLAGGCFWGVEEYFSNISGVIATDVGYANSKVSAPSYEDVIAGGTDASETVRVLYDPKKVSLPFILDMYARIIDPTSVDKQGNDRGRQYRTGIYYTDRSDRESIDKFIVNLQRGYEAKIAIEVMKLENYYPAEEYHQSYLKKNPNGYCHIGNDKFRDAKEARDESLIP